MSKQRRHLNFKWQADRIDSASSPDAQSGEKQHTLEERVQRRFGTSSARRRSRPGGAPDMFDRAGAIAGDGAGHFFARLDHATLPDERKEGKEQDMRPADAPPQS